MFAVSVASLRLREVEEKLAGCKIYAGMDGTVSYVSAALTSGNNNYAKDTTVIRIVDSSHCVFVLENEEYKEYPEFGGYDLVTIPSEAERWIFEEFMGRPHNSPEIQAIGVSRTDEFFSEKYREKCYRKLYERIPEAREKKVILYAPTFRGLEPHRYAPDKLDVASFAERLGDRYILIIKHHQTAKVLPEIPEKYRGTFAFDMTHGSGMDINELMTVSDICITDYSSLVFEFSLFERPIAFFMFDKDEYKDQRGMYYTYDELAECGPVFENNKDVIDYIDDIENRFVKEKVTSFRDKYMNACDGKATERIIAFIYS